MRDSSHLIRATMTPDSPGDSPVLVVVVNDPNDLARARDEGWWGKPVTITQDQILER